MRIKTRWCLPLHLKPSTIKPKINNVNFIVRPGSILSVPKFSSQRVKINPKTVPNSICIVLVSRTILSDNTLNWFTVLGDPEYATCSVWSPTIDNILSFSGMTVNVTDWNIQIIIRTNYNGTSVMTRSWYGWKVQK